MLSLKSYLAEYSTSHQNQTNQMLHNVCVPLITWSLLGALHTVELMNGFYASHLFVVAALIYYSLFRKILVVVAMALISGVFLYSFNYVPQLFWSSILVFVVAWSGQFYGHHVEGKRPSFLKDLTFLLIGPVWVLKKVFPNIDS